MSVAPDTTDYDFIVVGAGSAGCLITSRLSQRLPNHRIPVLEAGEHIRNDPKVQVPGLSSTLLSNPDYDWQYVSEPEPGLNNRRVKQPRGKLVGGSSAINSHSVVFPNREWHDRLAGELLSGSGHAEWGSEGMRDCYRRWQTESSGSRVNGDDDDSDVTESVDSVKTSYPRKMDVLQTQWMKVFEELDYPTSATGFTESLVGAVAITNAVDPVKSERSHAGTAFLEPALKQGNVILEPGVKVNKIIFDDDVLTTGGKLNASGIRYICNGKEILATAREIILCAGVFESPSILERSGIGSKEILKTADVTCLYELPGVGENLQDHLNCSLSFETQDHIPTRDEALQNPEEPKAALAEYERSRTGRMSEGPAYSFAFTPLQMLETPAETEELTEAVKRWVGAESNVSLRAQYSIIQKIIENPREATATSFMLRSQRHRDADSLPRGTPSFVDGNYVTVVAMLSHPFSRGSCHITSNSSHQSVVKFKYFSHPLDVEILARHLRLIERLSQQPAFAVIIKSNGRRSPRSHPFPMTSLEHAKEVLPINSATNYHPCGTCSMMRKDLGGVVDEELIVYGTRNVRVCDASVLSIIPRGNILTAVYAFAEKAAELICKEAKKKEYQGGIDKRFSI